MDNILKFKVFAVLGIFVFFTGCNSCGPADPGNSNTNTPNVIVPKKATNSAVQTNVNGENNLVPYPGSENASNPTLDNSKVKVINPDMSKAATPMTRLPDGSEMTASMAQDGSFVETRTFLNDPQLAKLERHLKSPKDITVKVYLKTGKVISVPEGTIKDYRKDSAATILATVGVKVSRPENSGSSAGTKKDPAAKQQ